MVRKNIPISFVKNRHDRLNSQLTFNRAYSCTYEQVIKSINNDLVDETSIVRDYMRDSIHPDNCNSRLESCLHLLEECSDQPYYDSVFSNVKDVMIPSCSPTKLDSIYDSVDSYKIPEANKEEIKDTIKDCKSADRVLGNKKMIEKRFDLDDINTRLKKSIGPNAFSSISDVCESFAELIDTYDMPIKKKVAVSLETVIYMNECTGNTDNKEAVKSILEYYLSSYPVIPDTDHRSIMHTLEYNQFIKDSDLEGINYMFNNAGKEFSEKILEAADKEINKEYKKLIIDIGNCKSVAAVKGLIKAAFSLIMSTFILAATVTFSTVTVLLCALFSLIVIVAISPAVLVKGIKSELDKTEKAAKALNVTRDQMKRYNKVYKLVGSLSSSVQDGEGLVEAAKIADSLVSAEGIDAPVLKDHIDDTPFNMIDYTKAIQESEKWADSDDVKDLIKAYKADQDKNMPKLKKIVHRMMSKKPEYVIDDIPDVIGLIRTFAILSTVAVPIVGPAIALVGSIANQVISLGYKRDEAEAVLKYFKSEKDKMEKKYNKMKDGDKKDDLDDYIKCLDKCIDKLESYRDSLYTDAELDRKYEEELEEASLNFCNKLDINEFMSMQMPAMILATSRAVQIIRNDIVRNPELSLKYDEYEYNNSPISSSLKDISKNELMSFYITPAGIIDIPLGKIEACCDNDAYMKAVDICERVNQFIDKDFIVTSYKMGETVVLTLNCTTAIAVDYMPEMDNTLTESAMGFISKFKINEDIVDMMTECGLDTMESDLCSMVDIIADDRDSIEICSIIKTSGLDPDQFIDSLKDYRYCCPKNELNNIDCMIDVLSKECPAASYDGTTELQSVYQLEATQLLRSVIEEAKNEKKDKDNKNKKKDDKSILDKAKDKVNNAKTSVQGKVNDVKKDIEKKNKNKEKVPIGTTAKLAASGAANKVKDASTKEKEVSRTIDAYVATITKSCKDALTSNRRESIIKGSIIPSFSRMIKAALGVGAVAVIFNPTAAAITAIGALATSKYLTLKEKKLLLEEIEVEKEVIAKQLDNVGDDPKRHKQLLMYQRKLQRESQRIRYGLAVKGKDAPDPND